MNTVAKLFEFGSRDARLIADRHTDTVFPIARFASRGQVEKRREELTFNALMAAGLYPLPEKTPLNVRREVVLRCDGYTVEKIMFETRPGFWSTGNLYMPSRLEAPAPAILNVIGHWEKQRLTRAQDADYPQQLANFAKMGFVCLVTDMVGKVDSRQITHEYGRDEKELWCSNALGAQLWNNIRALDLLCGMPEVDENRIGMTGASGGGSQTLLLALVDERVKAAAPINMISLRMQGGCQCENAPGLRRDTENAEMCAMLAPRPLFLAGSTGDWTQCQETEEYPAVLEAYRHYGAEGNVWHYYQAAGHQYNARTRRRVYRFFAHYLMGKDVDWEEEAVPPFDTGVLTWFPQNDGGSGMEPRGDEAYFEAQKAERKRAVAALTADEKRRMLRWITGVCGARAVVADGFCEEAEGLKTERSVITSTRGEQIPFVRITPERWRGRTCLMVSGAGKDCVLSDEAKALL
ncbi:MAG: acetylxylan esterase, partial [Clostridia bacterium]|nr:acetylxylan esterase [Clostridia bacterium]